MSSGKGFLIDPDKREKGAEDVRAFIMSCRPNKRLLVEVKEYQKRRSDEQNRYLWLLYGIIEKETGNDKETIHEFMLGSWSGWEIYDCMGEKRKRPVRRSSKLNKMEFSEFVAHIQMKSAEFGIYLPDPE